MPNTENASIILGAVVILLYLFMLGYLIFTYVMQSLSLYTLAKRRGIANPAFAWIPCGNYWIIGSLARDYDKQHGIKRRWDKTLFILSLVSIISLVVIYVVLFVYIIVMALKAESEVVADELALEMIAPLLIIYLALILVMIVAMTLSFTTYICIYKIFESTVPEKSLKYFLISMLVPFGQPICLFLCRNKGYQHPDPFAYLYAPVNKNYNYYAQNTTVSANQNAETQATAQPIDNTSEEQTDTEE